VEQGEIQDICEYYAPLRLKTGNNDNLANELITIGIKYFEIRILDLNPLCRVGINKDILYIIHLFVLLALFKEEEEFTEEEHNIACMNAELASLNGRYENLLIFEDMNTKGSFKDKALKILEDMEELLKRIQCYDDYFNYLIATMKDMINSPEETFSSRVFKGIKERSYINFHMEKAKEYLQ
jgi:glutamate--cysteine ligase